MQLFLGGLGAESLSLYLLGMTS